MGVLGCILISPASCLPDCITRFNQRADAFYDLRHQTIFEAMMAMHRAGTGIDVVTLQGQLKDEGLLDQAGGIAYLSPLPDSVPSASNLTYYLDRVCEKYRMRKLVNTCTDLVGRVYDYTGDIDTLMDSAERDLGQVFLLGGTGNDLQDRLFSFSNVPPPLTPVFTLCGDIVCTVGNLTAITSQAKTGKSAIIGSMLAAAICNPLSECDLLGFSSSNDDERAIVHFDTEQSPNDHWHGIERAIERADLSEPPKHLLSYCLTGLLPRDAWASVKRALAQSAKRFGGIHSILIDGVGDLVHDVNDAGECNDFVAELHGLAISHHCPIIGVLHFNPETAKARGHLGSQLERKSESNLRLDKEDDTTVLWSNKQRRGAISKDFGPRFRWSNEKGMHVTVETNQEARRGAAAEAEIPCRDDVFHEHSAMRYNDLVAAIETTVKCGNRTAQRRLTKWMKLGIVEKSVGGLWCAK